MSETLKSICVDCGSDSNTMLCDSCAQKRITNGYRLPAGYQAEWERMRRDYFKNARKLSIAEVEAEERELW